MADSRCVDVRCEVGGRDEQGEGRGMRGWWDDGMMEGEGEGMGGDGRWRLR